MAISVDIPEPIGFENYIMNYSLFQISRIIIYSLPIIYFSIVFSPWLIFLIPLPFLLMKYKFHGMDFDIFFVHYIKWKIFRKVLQFDDITETYIISHEEGCWRSSEGLNAAIVVDGISIDFFDDESRNSVYESYCKFLNGIDFSLSIYIFSLKAQYEVTYYSKNPTLERIIRSQMELIKNLKNNFSKKIFLLVITEKYIVGSMDYSKSKNMLEENVNYVIKSLESMGLRCRRLNFYEFKKIVEEIA